MPLYIVEIETPAGRRVRKGTAAADEAAAVAGIKHLQMVTGKNGIPKCVRGEIVDVWLREPGRPFLKSVLESENAVEIFRHCGII